MICPVCGKDVSTVRVLNLPTKQVHVLNCGHEGQVNPDRGSINSKHGTEVELSRAKKNGSGDVIGYEHYTATVDTRELIPVTEDEVETHPVVVDHRISKAQLKTKAKK